MFSSAVVCPSLLRASRDQGRRQLMRCCKRLLICNLSLVYVSDDVFILAAFKRYNQTVEQLNFLNSAVLAATQPVIDHAAAETCSTRTNVQLFDQ